MPIQSDINQDGERLYEQYGRPLEAEHWGEYVMITRDGYTLVAPTAVEAFVRGSEMLGSGHFIFKVGDRFVVTLR